MSVPVSARNGFGDTLECLLNLLKRVNGWEINDYKFPSLLPDISFNSFENFHSNLGNVTDTEFLNYVKHDFGKAGWPKGHIEFRALTTLANQNPDYNPQTDPKSKKYIPFNLFEYPPKNAQGANWSWGVSMLMDVTAFSIDYDFTQNDYYSIKLKDVKISFELKSWDPNDTDDAGNPLTDSQGNTVLTSIFTTPFISASIEIKIPQSFDLSIEWPHITIDIMGLKFDFDPNFPNVQVGFITFNPLYIELPDWLNWPLGPIDFGNLLNLSMDCNWSFGLISPYWAKFRSYLGDIDFSFLKPIIDWFCEKFGFLRSSTDVKVFTHAAYTDVSQKIPEWAAIYLDLSGFCQKILSGFPSNALHLMIGIRDNGQVNAGFLVCTGPLGIFNNKPLMLQANVQYKVQDIPELEALPSFAIDVMTDQTLGEKASCPEPTSATIKFGGFWIEAKRLGLKWNEKDKTWTIYVDGRFIIKELLRSAESSSAPDQDLILPFKGLGVTTDGRLVMKNTWEPLEKAPQVKLDGIKQIGLSLKGYGYGKEDGGKFWVGFSGDIELPVLKLSAGVDHLIIKSHSPFFELSGVNIDLDIEKVLHIAGAAKWGESLSAPLAGTDAKGFGAQLTLEIPCIKLACSMGFTYVKVQMGPEDFIAWSFFGDAPLPVPIPICSGIIIDSVGLMIGQNYIPLPKKMGIPREHWLEQGFNGNVENILNTVGYWTVSPDTFSAGFSIGLATTDRYILNAKGILVIVVPGPLVMVAGKANILSRSKRGAFDLLIIYDQDDPGILASLAFQYDVKKLIHIRGMAEFYFDFSESRWHFYLGTPQKPVAVKVFWIFDAKGWLTIDSRKLAVGAYVNYGNTWSFGPLYIKAFVSCGGEVVISWNPPYVQAYFMLAGGIAAKVFGFGFDIGLSAELLTKAPNPWYLYAEAEATFRISFIFWSWSFTAHLEFSWGQDVGQVTVVLPRIHDESTIFKLNTSSTGLNVSLTSNPNGLSQTRYLPMDGLIGLQFDRDIEIDTSGPEFPKLACFTPVQINDEKSPNADNYKRFHAKLNNFKILQKAPDGSFNPVTREIYFTWTPLDAAERKKLIARDFDVGCSQFRLNDDPNASVKLQCPDLYQTENALLFHSELPDFPEGEYSFTVDSPLEFSCNPCSIDVKLTQSPPGDHSFSLNYSDFTVKLYSDAIIPVEKDKYRMISLRSNDELELGMPAACIIFLFKPDQSPPQQTDFTLIDELENNVTKDCIINIAQHPDGYIVMLNDFDTSTNVNKTFSTQLPPKYGVKKIVFQKSGALLQSLQKTTYDISLYPIEALQEIHRRNLELIEQKAKLEYVFGQNGDPGMLLWDVGEYKVTGTGIWQTDKGEKEPMDFTPRVFHVIPAFEKYEVEVEGKTIEVQPFHQYVRRFTPYNGARLFYRDQHPSIAYRCNYVNAMLNNSKRRLAAVLVDSDNNPCRYTKITFTPLTFEAKLKAELLEILNWSRFHSYRHAADLEEQIPKLIRGLDPSVLSTALSDQLESIPRKQPIRKREDPSSNYPGIRVSIMNRDSLLGYARALRRRRAYEMDKEVMARAEETERFVSTKFISEQDRALVLGYMDVVVVGVIKVVQGIMEYRYTNDDLTLDVTTLNLSDCLSPGQAQKLNAYERGYFAPILPEKATWDGLNSNTRYTIKVYSLNKDEDIGNTLPTKPEIYSSSFTTSLFESIEGLASLFHSCKVRDLYLMSTTYDDVVSMLKPYFIYALFTHPADSGIKLHFGMDLFREILKTQDIDPSGFTPRDLEEKHQLLVDESRASLEKARLKESLNFEDLIDSISLSLDPISSSMLVATWLRTADLQGNPESTIGLLIDFPEPIDWERTGIRITRFKVKIEGEENEVDLLDPPTGNPSYESTFNWIRNLDGTRLILIPKIIQTRVDSPMIVVPGLEWVARADEMIKERIVETARRTPGAIPENHPMLPTNPSSDKGTTPTLGRNVRVGDFAVASTMGVKEKAVIDSIYQKLGKKTVKNISKYEVFELDLEFYYFSDNYENKNSKYRAIPRLTYITGRPGDALGKIGTLTPLSSGGASS